MWTQRQRWTWKFPSRKTTDVQYRLETSSRRVEGRDTQHLTKAQCDLRFLEGFVCRVHRFMLWIPRTMINHLYLQHSDLRAENAPYHSGKEKSWIREMDCVVALFTSYESFQLSKELFNWIQVVTIWRFGEDKRKQANWSVRFDGACQLEGPERKQKGRSSGRWNFFLFFSINLVASSNGTKLTLSLCLACNTGPASMEASRPILLPHRYTSVKSAQNGGIIYYLRLGQTSAPAVFCNNGEAYRWSP